MPVPFLKRPKKPPQSIICPQCDGDGCSECKGTGRLEVIHETKTP
jgi:hypothetical protein